MLATDEWPAKTVVGNQRFDISYHISRGVIRYKVSLNLDLETSLEEALQFALDLEGFEKNRLIEVRWGRDSWIALFEQRVTIEQLLAGRLTAGKKDWQ